MLEVFLHHPSIRFFFFFVFLFLPRSSGHDEWRHWPTRTIKSHLQLHFEVFTMQHLHIFFTSYVLIGNLRLACCCDCSIGHEIAKKRLSQVGQQRLRWCVRSHREIHQNSNFLRTHFCSSLCFMESGRRLTFEPLTRVGEESIGYRRSFYSFEIH